MQKEFNLLSQDSQASDNVGTNRTLDRQLPARTANEESKKSAENKDGMKKEDVIAEASPNVEYFKYGSLMSS